MAPNSLPIRPAPRWLHAWAILTVIATACLLVLGGLVTTFRVGMADPVWPTTPWYLFFIDWREPSAGFLIEHTHRLAGYIVGCLAIVLAIGAWRTGRTRAVRWLGPICLLAIIAQGLLGGFRVKLNALMGTDLAAVHGCFAQIVFSLLVSTAVLTAASSLKLAMTDEDRLRCRKLAKALVGLVFVQLVWGALVRHNPSGVVQRLHLLTAFVVVGVLVAFIKTVRGSATAWQHLRRGCILLEIFVSLQVLLGVEAWMGKFGTSVLPELQRITPGMAIVRTGHVLIGTGILATSVSLLLLTRRPVRMNREQAAEAFADRPLEAAPRPAHQLGGAL